MKIEKKEFIEFLDKIRMTSSATLEEAIFDFSEQGLKISAVIAANMGQIDSILKPTAFVEYEAIGKIGVQELEQISRIMNKFDKELNLVVEGNLLTVKGAGKKVDIELMDIKFIKEPVAFKQLEYAETFTINGADLSAFYDDVAIDKDDLELTFTTSTNKVALSNTGKYKFNKEILAEGAIGKTVVMFGPVLTHATSQLKGNLTISSKTNFPIKIVETTENSVIALLIAPKVKKA